MSRSLHCTRRLLRGTLQPCSISCRGGSVQTYWASFSAAFTAVRLYTGLP